MYIPSWILWIMYFMGFIGFSCFMGRSKGDYDLFSPIIGWAIFVIGIAFAVGFWLG